MRGTLLVYKRSADEQSVILELDEVDEDAILDVISVARTAVPHMADALMVILLRRGFHRAINELRKVV